MATIYDCGVESELLEGMRLARGAFGRGELIVIPTDTVYGLSCDAFSPAAVSRLLAAKGRDRSSPPPVLVPGLPTLDALAEHVPDAARTLVRSFWPGGLTLILPARESLTWDLGDTHGTVALRMPAHPIALELLSETGPLAVSSANVSGEPAARTAQDALDALGDTVAVYLDAGEVGGDAEEPRSNGSTIIDFTRVTGDEEFTIVRHGVITDDAIREALA